MCEFEDQKMQIQLFHRELNDRLFKFSHPILNFVS